MISSLNRLKGRWRDLYVLDRGAKRNMTLRILTTATMISVKMMTTPVRKAQRWQRHLVEDAMDDSLLKLLNRIEISKYKRVKTLEFALLQRIAANQSGNRFKAMAAWRKLLVTSHLLGPIKENLLPHMKMEALTSRLWTRRELSFEQ